MDKKRFVEIMKEYGQSDAVIDRAWETRPAGVDEEQARKFAEVLKGFSDIFKLN